VTRPRPTCLVEGCTKPAVGRGRCESHRAALRRHDLRYLLAERERKLKARYGLSLDEAEALYAASNHCCRICGEPWEAVGGLVIDHCAETGQVRGALCHDCNRGLGLFREDPALLEAAIAYLSTASDALID